jgi:hypothetical protein
MVLGTPDYMAPELIMGRAIDGRVDQYALGTIVYEWLAGRVPFRAATPAAVLVKQTTLKARPLHEANRAIPEPLSQVVMQALSKRPEKRHDSCMAFSEQLLGAIDAADSQIFRTPPRTKTNPQHKPPSHSSKPVAQPSETKPLTRPPQEISPETRPARPPRRTELAESPAGEHFLKRKTGMSLAVGGASIVLCLALLFLVGGPKKESKEDSPSAASPETSQTTPGSTPKPSLEGPGEERLPIPATEDSPDDTGELAGGSLEDMTPQALIGPNDPPPGTERNDNSLGMPFCYCPPGVFTMGSSPNDPDHRGNEDRQDVLLTEGFWLGKQEVTQAAWKKVMGSTPWPGRNEIREGDDYPASFVSWEDATAFCENSPSKSARPAGCPATGFTHCPPRPNGNTPAGRDPRQSISSVMTTPGWANSPGFGVTLLTLSRNTPRAWEKKRLILGVCRMCTATSPSGARTGIKKSCPAESIPWSANPVRSACFAEGLLVTTIATPDQPRAVDPCRATGPPLSGFGWLWFWRTTRQ